MRVAAVQLDVNLGDVDTNLAECERLAQEASRAGAELVALPEFFSRGAVFKPEAADGIRPPIMCGSRADPDFVTPLRGYDGLNPRWRV
jgi:hypothetical protein